MIVDYGFGKVLLIDSCDSYVKSIFEKCHKKGIYIINGTPHISLKANPNYKPYLQLEEKSGDNLEIGFLRGSKPSLTVKYENYPGAKYGYDYHFMEYLGERTCRKMFKKGLNFYVYITKRPKFNSSNEGIYKKGCLETLASSFRKSYEEHIGLESVDGFQYTHVNLYEESGIQAIGFAIKGSSKRLGSKDVLQELLQNYCLEKIQKEHGQFSSKFKTV